MRMVGCLKYSCLLVLFVWLRGKEVGCGYCTSQFEVANCSGVVARASYCPMSRLSECKIASLRDGYTHLRNVLLCMSSGYEGSHRKRMSTRRKRKR